MKAERIAFTGTRAGMTDKQKRSLREMILKFRPTVFVHGGAVGADLSAKQWVIELLPDCEIFEIRPELGRSPLDRNAKIIEGADLLIAAPASLRETFDDGTWATIRLARKARIPILFLDPV